MTDSEKLGLLIRESLCFGYDDITDTEYVKCEETAKKMIANGVTVQQWIPVTERLPEDDLPKDNKVKLIKVLVFYKTSMGVPVVRTQIRQKGRRYHRDEWSWAKFEPITHWMPLPPPPKGE